MHAADSTETSANWRLSCAFRSCSRVTFFWKLCYDLNQLSNSFHHKLLRDNNSRGRLWLTRDIWLATTSHKKTFYKWSLTIMIGILESVDFHFFFFFEKNFIFTDWDIDYLILNLCILINLLLHFNILYQFWWF